MRNKTKFYLYLFYIIYIIVAMVPLMTFAENVNAARLYFNPEQGSWPAGEKFTIELRLDTEGARVNKVRAVFEYAVQSLKIEKLATKDSIITEWNNGPDFLQSDNVGSITFDGIIKDNFSGDGLIGKITLSGKQEDFVRLVFSTKTDLQAPTEEENSALGFYATPAEFNITPQKEQAGFWNKSFVLIVGGVIILLILVIIVVKRMLKH